MDSFPPVPHLLGGSPTWVAQLRTAPRLVWCREEISAILSCDSIDRWLEASLHLASLLRQENTVGLFCVFFSLNTATSAAPGGKKMLPEGLQSL